MLWRQASRCLVPFNGDTNYFSAKSWAFKGGLILLGIWDIREQSWPTPNLFCPPPHHQTHARLTHGSLGISSAQRLGFQQPAWLDHPQFALSAPSLATSGSRSSIRTTGKRLQQAPGWRHRRSVSRKLAVLRETLRVFSSSRRGRQSSNQSYHCYLLNITVSCYK